MAISTTGYPRTPVKTEVFLQCPGSIRIAGKGGEHFFMIHQIRKITNVKNCNF